ncbi:SulP family inorganic anion transporter [Leptospira alstonii]|uniref:Inorganic anion transporter, SulP family n=2 Tax=Leptospira alstonii TaxID=28452 RepID=M6D262_9LEPT|nr:SulP family inorganic anion transporter [Leptospira alstonii]EMJ98019.1 inorganic anion transporter, SulP family [Leptospira alstonii serovar Sichuan str. 79601]EQA81063.1 inorganic anion transporter, SulP family [Leptospira alstonii serovar Pingchang str. 80-412]
MESLKKSTHAGEAKLVTPKDFLPGLLENWKSDILSGFIIFLIALPLCIGIAIASGAPPMAGILSGIVGGLLVSILGGSYITINGPAAGLIVIVLGSIETLGHGDLAAGFKYTLAATVIAGALQIFFSFMRAGVLATIFPSAVIHGMLAAIGVIIFLKQFFTAVGYAPATKSIIGLIKELPIGLVHLNPEIAIVGFISIIVLVGIPFLPNAKLKKIPGPLVVASLGIAMGVAFQFNVEHTYSLLGNEFTVGPKSLVSIPANFLDGFTFPDFSRVNTVEFFSQVMAIFLVASLESQLTVAAVDKLDPYRRNSDLNRDLFSKGVGNFVLGLIGGLPIIAEVVRSSANIHNGAKTRWSNFFHGAFLLIFILVLPGIARMIPLASLAAILMVTGYRLAIPELKKTWKVGMDQVFLFFITIYFTIADDLLVGIFAGVVAKFAIHILNIILPKGITLNDFFRIRSEIHETNQKIRIEFYGLAIFLNFISIRKVLYSIPKSKNVQIDLSGILLVDHSVMENLLTFSEKYEEEGGKFELVGLEKLKPLSNHPSSGRKNVAW